MRRRFCLTLAERILVPPVCHRLWNTGTPVQASRTMPIRTLPRFLFLE